VVGESVGVEDVVEGGVVVVVVSLVGDCDGVVVGLVEIDVDVVVIDVVVVVSDDPPTTGLGREGTGSIVPCAATRAPADRKSRTLTGLIGAAQHSAAQSGEREKTVKGTVEEKSRKKFQRSRCTADLSCGERERVVIIGGRVPRERCAGTRRGWMMKRGEAVLEKKKGGLSRASCPVLTEGRFSPRVAHSHTLLGHTNTLNPAVDLANIDNPPSPQHCTGPFELNTLNSS
jgi:hypothetical protein